MVKQTIICNSKTKAKARNKVKNILRRKKKNYEKGIATNVVKSPKLFWESVRRKIKTKNCEGPLLKKC